MDVQVTECNGGSLQIPEAYRAAQLEIPAGKTPLQKVLGVKWDTTTDELRPYASTTVPTNRLSLRKVLSYVSAIFDPLSLISPVTITARALIQEIHRRHLGMDEPLTRPGRSARSLTDRIGGGKPVAFSPVPESAWSHTADTGDLL